MNLMSGTVNSGYNALVEASYSSGVYIANLHHDIVGNYNETSIQGPFTEQHVGGLQYRHIDLNDGNDNSDNRPEGWGLSIAEHPVDPSADGALGFVGADYDTSGYPDSTSLKATRYREEHAKRPINVRNIKTLSGSQKVGNYTNEIQLFSVSPTFQKTWAIEAYEDLNVNILPLKISSILPNSSHYQTLVAQKATAVGNIFGSLDNNRQVDEKAEIQSIGINSGETSSAFRMASSTAISGYSAFTTGGKTISFWINLDNDNLAARFIARGQNATSAAESFSIFFSFTGVQAKLYYRVRGPLGTKVWYWNIDYGEYVGIWNHLAITWDGDTTNAPKLYKNASATTATVQSGPNGVTTIYAPERIYLFDDGTTSSSNYELQGSLQDFAIYSGEFSLSTIQTIYNSGVVLDTPHLSANLLDYWKLGNGLNLQVGDSVPASTILSSSFGFKNHLTSSTTVLTAVAEQH